MQALLVNYEYCTGCHSCEIACRNHLSLGKGEFGIKLSEIGPYEYKGREGSDKWELTWMPVVTKACDMCDERVAAGKMPECVQHCQAFCMYYGEVEDMAKMMGDGTRWALLTSRA